MGPRRLRLAQKGADVADDLEQRGINVIRGLAMDAVQKANSGHPGTPMALAPLAHVLWTRIMKYDASASDWPDRDRFVLSNGHASMLLYAMLYLTGFGLELDDLRAFRQWGAPTAGHPEYGHAAGIEVTTGPLGQGFANGVGIALAEANLRAIKEILGLSPDDHFVVPDDVLAYYRDAGARGGATRADWDRRRAGFREGEPSLAAEYEACVEQRGLPGWEAKLPTW